MNTLPARLFLPLRRVARAVVRNAR